MDRALAEKRIEGVKTTTGFLRRLLRNPRFRRGRVTTGMLDES
jgi:acetyl-CoA carboxylase, biotin carboxylase subunit